jgi:hypothetical protein
VGIRYSYTNGTVSYSGHEVSAPYSILSSPSGEIINDVGIEIGKGVLFQTDTALVVPVIQAEYRHWARSVTIAHSPDEDYAFFAAGIGLRGDYALTERVAVTAKVGWEYMINPTDQTSANPSISKPANLLSLGARPIYQVSLGLDYRLIHDIHAFLEANYSRFSFGESPPVYYYVGKTRDDEYEPPSLTNDLVLELGIAWAF